MARQDTPMTLSDHLAELRRRLTYALVSVFVITVVCFFWGYTPLKQILTAPLDLLDPNTTNPFTYYNPLAKKLLPLVQNSELKEPVRLHATDIMQTFSVKIKLSMLAGLVLSAPIVLYQLWAFIGAGLLDRERRVILRYLPLSLALFLFGIAAAYFVALPTALIYLLTVDPDVRQIPSYGSYFSMTIWLMLAFGAAFQLPLVMMALGRLGIVTPRTLIRSWRYAVVIIFVLSAVLTPSGDPFTLCLLAIPLCGLYVLGIWLARSRKKEAE